MKTKVRKEFPLLARDVRANLRSLGWKRTQVKAQMKPADYVSPTGRVKRFKDRDLPEPPQPVHFIIGTNAATLKIVKSSDKSPPRYSGTKAECEAVMKKAIAQWFTLPVGREIEHITGAKMEMLETAKP